MALLICNSPQNHELSPQEKPMVTKETTAVGSEISIAKLPQEIIEKTASYLPAGCPDTEIKEDYETQTPKDIMNLRLTCRQLDRKLQYHFVHEIILSKKWRYVARGNCSSFEADPIGLRTLNAVTKIDVLRTSMRRIEFEVPMLSHHGLNLVAGDCVSYEDISTHLARLNLSNYRSGDVIPAPSATMSLHKVYQRLLDDQESVLAPKSCDEFMMELFGRGFPDLKIICIRRTYDRVLGPYSWKARLSDPRIKNYRGYPADYVEASHKALSQAASAVVKSVIKNGIELDKLIITQGCRYDINIDEAAAGIWIFDQPAEVLQTANIKELCLQLSNGSKGSTPAGWTKERGCEILIRVVDNLPNLEALSLAPARYEILEPYFVADLLSHCSGKIKELHLHDFAAFADTLGAFFSKNESSSMHTISLTKGHLLGARWLPLVQQLHDNTNFTKIQLGYLYELAAEHYYLLGWQCYDSDNCWCGMGAWDEGRWTPGCCDGEHHVSLNPSGSDTDRSWLEAGLSHILAHAEARLYEWTDRCRSKCGTFIYVPLKHEVYAKAFFGWPEPDYDTEDGLTDDNDVLVDPMLHEFEYAVGNHPDDLQHEEEANYEGDGEDWWLQGGAMDCGI
ncbi:hypothetical protein DBV05_g3513 [Lasiodiplodia theobromae]|uniref:Uncharacterized protein n=1 Tax=Lasiodiplodia theobromae TaxID=45133 RepID=A0A5N5DLK3_9PEZI|nr:hypothetical protein DBV05_g3513 [Lasiodiplodia theobromae]